MNTYWSILGTMMAEEDSKFLAAVDIAMSEANVTQLLGFKQKSAEIWVPFYDNATARNADLDSIVFGSSSNECMMALQMKYPAEDPALSRVLFHRSWQGTITAPIDSQDGDSISILPVDAAFYGGTDIKEAIALGARIGKIQVSAELMHSNQIALWEKAGFDVPDRNDYYNGYRYSLKFAPKAVARRLKQRATRERTRPVRCEDCADLLRRMRTLIYDAGIRAPEWGGSKMDNVASALLATVACFNYLYGDNAHRALPEFRKLKQLWKARKVQTEKCFRCDKQTGIPSYSPLQDRRQLCNWMDTELRVRDCALHRGRWKPLRKYPDFDKFKDANYKGRKPMAKSTTVKKAAKKAAVKKAATKKAAVKKATKKATKKAAVKKATKKAPAAKGTEKSAGKKAATKSRVRVPKTEAVAAPALEQPVDGVMPVEAPHEDAGFAHDDAPFDSAPAETSEGQPSD